MCFITCVKLRKGVSVGGDPNGLSFTVLKLLNATKLGTVSRYFYFAILLMATISSRAFSGLLHNG